MCQPHIILSAPMLTDSALKFITCFLNVTLSSSQICVALGGETFIVWKQSLDRNEYWWKNYSDENILWDAQSFKQKTVNL